MPNIQKTGKCVPTQDRQVEKIHNHSVRGHYEISRLLLLTVTVSMGMRKMRKEAAATLAHADFIPIFNSLVCSILFSKVNTPKHSEVSKRDEMRSTESHKT